MLLILIIAFGLGYWIGRDSSRQTTQPPEQSWWLQRIINALVFTAQKEIDSTKNKSTKDALQRVIDAGYKEQYGYVPSAQNSPDSTVVASTKDVSVQELPQSAQEQGVALSSQSSRVKQDLDNTSLLLYFGAFLFVASIGLFVAFADVQGTLRTFLVGLVAAGMFSFGFWLYDTRAKLKEVGLTFIGIGMSAIPFVGLAAYYYAFDQHYGPAIWVSTSIATVLIYVLTLLRIQNTFISYMLIGGIVSLFESSVSIIEAPTYYYVWMLIIVGIVLQAISILVKSMKVLQDSSAQSASLLVPLTIFASFVLLDEGTWQFAVSLLLGALYYGLQFITAKKDREIFFMASHMLSIAAVSVGAYSLNERFVEVSATLLVLSVMHIVALLILPRPKEDAIQQKVFDVSLLVSALAIVVSLMQPVSLTVALLLAIVVGGIASYRMQRHDSFVYALGGWVALPVVVGQILPEGNLSYLTQSFLTFAFVIPPVIMLHSKQLKSMTIPWMESVRITVISLHVLSILFAFLAGEYVPLLISMLAIINMLALVETLREKGWAEVAVLYSLVPSVYVVIALNDDLLRAMPLFTWSVLAALAVNIFIALHYKLEAARWASSAGWVALPFALGIEEIANFELSASQQMWLYVIAGVMLSISRAIARGRLLSVGDVPLKSLDKESSYSYAVGLSVTTAIAVILAFASTASVVASTAVILLAGLVLVVGGTLIDREPQYFTFIPVIAQAALLRFMEPYDSGSWLNNNDNLLHMYVLLSSLLALGFYAWVITTKPTKENKNALEAIGAASVATVFIAPFSFFILGDVVWMMPVTLLVAGAVLLNAQWQEDQGRKEAIGYTFLAGVVWLMLFNGVDFIQAYTHLLAAQFALYGYIRHRQNDANTANAYWGYMLGAATIPLALQALSGGDNADIYGLWLLVENVMFFVVGIGVRNKLISRWGLYVAIGTVLYELRDLGWAVLSVIALVLIGIGAYRALHQPDEPNSSK